jgi:hypothetical protein
MFGWSNRAPVSSTSWNVAPPSVLSATTVLPAGPAK